MNRLLPIGIAAAVFALPAFAEVKTAAADALVLTFRAPAEMSRDTAWTRLTKPALWWSSDHTYSGAASNISLELKPGGCWCEVWPGGAVEHGHVLAVVPSQLLRLDAAFGPLQELAVKGVLSIEIVESDTSGQIEIAMTYRVVGSSESNLDSVAGVVDQVIGQQFTHLVHPG